MGLWRHLILLVTLSLGGGAPALSGPAEMPPPDFAARQYIDSRGCVFLRAEGETNPRELWQPRLGRDGEVLCGYPPTLSARRLTPDGEIARKTPAAPPPDHRQMIEEALVKAIIPNLQTGELASDRQPFAPRPDAGPEPMAEGPLLDLQAEIIAAPRIAREMSDRLKPNRSLCELLGYDGEVGRKNGLGRDPSGGFCASLPENDLARLAFTRPATGQSDSSAEVAAGHGAVAGQDGMAVHVTQRVGRPPQRSAKSAGQSGETLATKPKASALASPKQSATAGQGGKVASKPKARGKNEAERIPAGARYVQVGVFVQRENADRVVTRLTALGLPMLRTPLRKAGVAQHVIVSGPFESRQDLVIALNQIRKSGYPDAYAR